VGDVATQIDVEIGRTSSMSSEYEMEVFGDGSRARENDERVDDNQEHLSHLLEKEVERMAGGHDAIQYMKYILNFQALIKLQHCTTSISSRL